MLEAPNTAKRIWPNVAVSMTIFQAIGAFSNSAYAPLSPFVFSDFHLRHTELGTITSVVFLGGSVVSLLAGSLVDIVGAQTMLNISAVTMGLSGVLGFFSQSFTLMLLTFLGIGLAYGVVTPSTNQAIIGAYAPRHGPLMGIKQAGVSIGGIAATFCLPLVAKYIGVREAFFCVTLFALLGIVTTNIGYQRQPKKKRAIYLRTLLSNLVNRSVLVFSLIIIVFIWLQQSILTYYVLFLSRQFSVQTGEWLLGAVFLGAIGGRILWGVINESTFKGNRFNGLATVGLLSSIVLFLQGAYTYPLPLQIVLALLIGMTSQSWNGLYVTIISEIAPRHLVGSSTGVSLSIAYLGAILGAPVSGMILDTTHSYFVLWTVIAGFVLVVSTLLFMPKIQVFFKAVESVNIK